ncbi:Phosphoadenosine phosphosulphate reductase domain-containing protein, partial [Dysosmobacter welbionis]
MEHPDILRLHGRKLRSAVMSGQIVEQNTTGHEHGAEYKIHENIGCKVEDGAGRSNPNHKTAYTGSIPFPGLCDKFFVHVIPGNRSTGQVVDQVQKNQMHAHHRQEGQQRGGRQYREHIAEVGGCGHLDILDHVGIGLAAFDNALLQNHQVFFQQNNIGRFLCYVYGGIHRNADVSGFHSGGIIDSIAHETNSMAVFPENRNHTCFLAGRQLGKYVGGFCGPCQLRIRHFLQIGAKEHIANLQPNLLADGMGHFVVVAGQDFGSYAVVFQRLDCIRGGFLRGIEERKIPNQ